MLNDTIYSINISLEEGRGTLQVRLTKPTGNVQLSLSVDKSDGSITEKTVMTFNSDIELKSVIEVLRQARVANLKNKGYKVVM